jgi:biotin-dependent carboxylase-like uncharacterized protein
VGNTDDAAGIEATLRGISFRTDSTTDVAVTGAPCALTVDGESRAFDECVRVEAGSRIAVGRAVSGMRSYVAFAGGLDVPAVLGSRAYDSLSGLGPAPLRPGTALPLGTAHADNELSAPTLITSDPTIRIRFGPRDDWFEESARRTLTSSAYHVTPLSNRVGARLAGPSLTRAKLAELPSEPLVLGSVQVLADGQPVVLLADHPTTGGYPVIAVVDERDIPSIAQMRPGGAIRFEEATAAVHADGMAAIEGTLRGSERRPG